MITWKEVEQIGNRLYQENTGSSTPVSCEDISRIVYYKDVFECGSTVVVSRHIDIEFSYGEYFEVCEGTPLFEYIGALCNLFLSQEEKETMVIYQK